MLNYFISLLFLCLALPITALPYSHDNPKRDVPYFTGVSPPAENHEFLRGVNIGGWLILEKWMNPEVFTSPFAEAVDQWTFDSTPGAAEALQSHWSTYFTEADVWTIKSYGFNAIRIPIGYWAFNNTNTPYLPGATTYLDNALSWARAANLQVVLDCHGSPGSQNGFDNSGHAGAIHWHDPQNLALSITVLETIAHKYGAMEYADVITAIEIVNEPTADNIEITRQFASEAYTAIKTASTSPDLTIITHDAFQPLSSWSPLASSLSPNFALDTHPYHLFPPTPPSLTQPQHISLACSFPSNFPHPQTYIGEFSALSNICVSPQADGTTTTIPGTSCDTPDCQCQSAPLAEWGPALVQETRRFLQAQVERFESAEGMRGWFLWSWEGPGGWGVRGLVERGVVPQPLGERGGVGVCS